jgi:hypothetical protein
MKTQAIEGFTFRTTTKKEYRKHHAAKVGHFFVVVEKSHCTAIHKRSNANWAFVINLGASTMFGASTSEVEAEKIARSHGLFLTEQEALRAGIDEARTRLASYNAKRIEKGLKIKEEAL